MSVAEVVVRPMRAEDLPGVAALHAGVSDDDVHLRFFGSGREPGRHYVDHLFSTTPARIALVALADDRVVGIATAETVDELTSEIAFIVAPDQRRHGIAGLLLHAMVEAGRAQGVTRLIAEVLPGNHPMAAVFAEAGLLVTTSTSAGVTEVTVSTATR